MDADDFFDQIGWPFDIVTAQGTGDGEIRLDLKIKRGQNAPLLILGHINAAKTQG